MLEKLWKVTVVRDCASAYCGCRLCQRNVLVRISFSRVVVVCAAPVRVDGMRWVESTSWYASYLLCSSMRQCSSKKHSTMKERKSKERLDWEVPMLYRRQLNSDSTKSSSTSVGGFVCRMLFEYSCVTEDAVSTF